MENKQKRKILGRSLAFVFVFVAWLTNAILRVFFGYLMVTGVQLLDVPVTQGTLNILIAAFLFLGLAGIIFSVGLWREKKWGYGGTLFLILSTIVFDSWGITIQLTAAVGFVAPMLVMIYFVMNRHQLIGINSSASSIFNQRRMK